MTERSALRFETGSAAVGAIDAIVAEENFFVASRSFTPDQILERLSGTASTVPLFAAPMFW